MVGTHLSLLTGVVEVEVEHCNRIIVPLPLAGWKEQFGSLPMTMRWQLDPVVGELTVATKSSPRALCKNAPGSGRAIEAGIADKRAQRETMENFISMDLTIGVICLELSLQVARAFYKLNQPFLPGHKVYQ
jgi:hypothetical protein